MNQNKDSMELLHVNQSILMELFKQNFQRLIDFILFLAAQNQFQLFILFIIHSQRLIKLFYVWFIWTENNIQFVYDDDDDDA